MPNSEQCATPVTIIGGGPVGLLLALLLDYFDVKSTIINTEPNERWHPKGNGQNARTMEIYRRLGFSDEVRKLGLPPDHPFDQAYFTRLSKHEIFRFPMPNREERIAMRRDMPVTDQFPEPMFHVNQMFVERFLLQKAKATANIDVRFGWNVDWFTQDEAKVRVHACNVASGEEVTWTSDYAVACDGARGFVRKTLGIAYEGDVQKKDAYWAGQFFSVHMRIPDLYPKFVGHRRAWMYWAVNPDPNTRGVIIALNGDDEFMMLVKPRGGRTDVDKDEVVRWVQGSIGEDIPVHVIGYYPWSAGQALVAERYKAGRIMIAGDAAHVFTPTGGFGMNTGMDDSANLAWKLAAVLQGWGGSKLLDTYQTERKPAGIRNTGASRKYASMMHDANVPENVEDEGPEGDAARITASNLTYVRKNHFVRPEDEDATGVQIGFRYDGSPIVIGDEPPPPDIFPATYDRYTPSGIPGGRLPHLWLDAERVMGSSLYDHLGKGFTLLRLNKATDTSAFERAAAQRNIPLKVLDVELAEARALYERDLVLVRPDQIISWRGNAVPDDPDAVLTAVTGN
ncbi:MAG TPA: FAD-dependent monooxygenase [Xanthobacteraceae bacterium]|jgi:2-polyprenyl-6-methoxyphenol hydroxylase-like FAD-dependent oxidoreductase|nr:FAD-dependent monooxygenase [Xanthobacteraceae bacterium]